MHNKATSLCPLFEASIVKSPSSAFFISFISSMIGFENFLAILVPTTIAKAATTSTKIQVNKLAVCIRSVSERSGICTIIFQPLLMV